MTSHEPLTDAVTGFPSEYETALQQAAVRLDHARNAEPLRTPEDAIVLTAAETADAIASFAPEPPRADLVPYVCATPLAAPETELEIRATGAHAVEVADDVGVLVLPQPAPPHGRRAPAIVGLAATIAIAVLGAFAFRHVPAETLPAPTPPPALTAAPADPVTMPLPALGARPFLVAAVAHATTVVDHTPELPARVEVSAAAVPTATPAPPDPGDARTRLALLRAEIAAETARRTGAIAPLPNIKTVAVEPEAPIIPTILTPAIVPPAPTATGAARPTAIPAAPPANAAAAPGAATSAATDAISAVLDRYRGAFNTLDAEAARAVWPGADVRTLGRAFSGLVEQQLSFDDCAITLHGESATADCRGTATYVPKVGRRNPRAEPRHWHFEVQRRNAAWLIQSVAAR